MVPENLLGTFPAKDKVDTHIHGDQTERVVIRIRPAVGRVLINRIILEVPGQVAVARRVREEVILGVFALSKSSRIHWDKGPDLPR